MRQFSGITTGRISVGSDNGPALDATMLGTEIQKSRPKSRRALPEIVLATSPTRSRIFSSLVSDSFIRISKTISIERGAVKQITPLRLPETAMTPVKSFTGGAPVVTRYGTPTATGWRADTSK
ncbi:MAG: hypothetical protein NTZ79_18785 [Proteobacteria bacterium]|nr:hypothetical protein [Pseudomonadota bacterium]